MKRKPNLTRRDVRIILNHRDRTVEAIREGNPLRAIANLVMIGETAIKIRNRAERDKRK